MTRSDRPLRASQGEALHSIGFLRIHGAIALPMVYRTGLRFYGDPFCGDAAAARGIACFHGQGRGRYVPGPLEGFTLLASLHGKLLVESNDGVFSVGRRHFICLPTSSIAHAQAGRDARWMALRLPCTFLADLARTREFENLVSPLLLPVASPLTREMLRCGAELLRSRPGGDAAHAGDQLSGFLLAALQAQSPCQEWVRRAYGRSERHRRRVVVRLLSARNRIVNAPFMSHDLDALAAAAMYSPSHFLRSFRDVFGKTPHGLLTESRVALACTLIRDSDLAIGEVAANVGYESRHAFSRLFKRETGITASDFRLTAGKIAKT